MSYRRAIQITRKKAGHARRLIKSSKTRRAKNAAKLAELDDTLLERM